jgi:hypothetical protein
MIGTTTAGGNIQAGDTQSCIFLNIEEESEPQTAIINVVKIVECTDSAIANIPQMCDPSWYNMEAYGIDPPQESQTFPGSDTGTPVSLDPGSYGTGESASTPPRSRVNIHSSPGCRGIIEAGQEVTCTYRNHIDYVEE